MNENHFINKRICNRWDLGMIPNTMQIKLQIKAKGLGQAGVTICILKAFEKKYKSL